MQHKPAASLALASLLLCSTVQASPLALFFPMQAVPATIRIATAQNDSTYNGPPYGHGTTIPNRPELGATTNGSSAAPGGAGIMGPAFGFTSNSRNTIGTYFSTYWLCQTCGYNGGAYTPYQAGGNISGTPYQVFPPELASQLPPAPAGTQYVFANRNAMLISQANGQILDVIPLADQ